MGEFPPVGKTPLVFVEHRDKVEKVVYKCDIIQSVVFLGIQHRFCDAKWRIQQNSAPVHRAKTTPEFCKVPFQGFMLYDEWLPYAPDEKLMNYSVRSIFEVKASAHTWKSLGSLKQSFPSEWNKITVEELQPIAGVSRSVWGFALLPKGGHFETVWIW